MFETCEITAEPVIEDALLSPKDVASIYGIHEKVVSRFVRAGRIPKPIKDLPKFKRWSKVEIMRDIAAMRQRAREEAAT